MLWERQEVCSLTNEIRAMNWVQIEQTERLSESESFLRGLTGAATQIQAALDEWTTDA